MDYAPWTTAQQQELERYASSGHSAAKVASAMGRTRSGILGRAHRTGVRFFGDEAVRQERAARPPRQKIITSRSEYMLARWASGEMGGKCVADEIRVPALAARLAGLSRQKAAAAFGVYHLSIRNWERNPALVAKAWPIAERALAETRAHSRAMAQAAADNQAIIEAATRAHNAPILARLNAREALICNRLLAGATLEEVGLSLGLTRERIRQLVTRVIVRDGLDTNGRFSGRVAYIPNGNPRGRPRKVSSFAQTVGAGPA